MLAPSSMGWKPDRGEWVKNPLAPSLSLLKARSIACEVDLTSGRHLKTSIAFTADRPELSGLEATGSALKGVAYFILLVVSCSMDWKVLVLHASEVARWLTHLFPLCGILPAPPPAFNLFSWEPPAGPVGLKWGRVE